MLLGYTLATVLKASHFFLMIYYLNLHLGSIVFLHLPSPNALFLLFPFYLGYGVNAEAFGVDIRAADLAIFCLLSTLEIYLPLSESPCSYPSENLPRAYIITISLELYHA